MLHEAEALATQPPVNPFRALLPQGRDFAHQVGELVQQLPARLGIAATELRGTPESLAAIDQRLRRLGSARTLTPELFAPLTAYVGEVIREAISGQWEMRLDDDGETWEPWIVDPQGRSYAPFAIFKEIYEHGRAVSLRGFVAGQIGSRLLGGQDCLH